MSVLRSAPTILFPTAKRPAFVYNQHGFIRKVFIKNSLPSQEKQQMSIKMFRGCRGHGSKKGICISIF